MVLVSVASGEEEQDEELAEGRALDEPKCECILSPAACVTFFIVR